MLKRLALGAGVALVALASPIGIGTGVAGAGAPPVTLTGPINCAAAVGQTVFGKGLSNNPSAQTSLTVKMKISECTGAGGSSGGVTLKYGLLKVTSAPQAMLNACGLYTDIGSLPTLTGTITWKGSHGFIAQSTVTVQGETGFYEQGVNELHLQLPVAIGTGSFAGQPVTTSGLDSNKSGFLLTSACSTFKGLKSYTFGHPASVGSVTGSVTIAGG
jgi:hypothetical protein